MIIKHPLISYENSMKSYNDFAKKYNNDKKYLREKLNSNHWMFINYFICEYRKMIADESKHKQFLMDTKFLPYLETNRYFFAKKYNCSVRTISNYIKKLMHAGAINYKTNFNNNFSLSIRPNFLKFTKNI